MMMKICFRFLTQTSYFISPWWWVQLATTRSLPYCLFTEDGRLKTTADKMREFLSTYKNKELPKIASNEAIFW